MVIGAQSLASREKSEIPNADVEHMDDQNESTTESCEERDWDHHISYPIGVRVLSPLSKTASSFCQEEVRYLSPIVCSCQAV